MNWKFWKKDPTLIPQTATRNIEDIKISVEEGLSNTRKIHVQAWTPELAKAIFWEIRDGLEGKRNGEV